ncbi:MAG: GcrA family cell cycle regulator [Pseudomonadota bacterium]
MAWTEERVERLKVLWSEGLTASQIAQELGEGVSRNAVIGKVHRLGLSTRSSAGNGVAVVAETKVQTADPSAGVSKKPGGDAKCEEREVSGPTVKAEQKTKSPSEDASETTAVEVAVEAEEQINPIAALAAEVERSARKLSLLELNERTCKWPIGDPATGDFYFCGLPCAPDKPYCSAHVAVAYQPLSSRRDRERDRSRAKAV